MTDATDATDATEAISPETAPAYLRERGLIGDEEATATSLGGGVSNRVIRVDAGDRAVVVKQPLPNLAVADDWPADVERVHNEAAAARAYADAIESAGLEDVRVPAVLSEDREAHVVVFDCAPDAAGSWKRELLDGRVDVGVARSLGRLLGTVHGLASEDDDLRERFGDKTPFDQLRVDPYHRTTAERHPEVADPILAEAERVMSVDRTLVHGDYSPKNVLVDRTTGARWLLDFEVAHWGDPAFDTAFMLNHLLIKSIHVTGRGRACLDAAAAFYDAYDAAVPWDIEADTARELAVLMLARVDGKSPVEYLAPDDQETVRELAVRALRTEPPTLEAFVSLRREVVA
jgi:5-methylthioribose kinase